MTLDIKLSLPDDPFLKIVGVLQYQNALYSCPHNRGSFEFSLIV